MDCICESCDIKNCPERTKQDDLRIVISCLDYVKHEMTNADRIRAMSDEELANWLARTQIGAIREAMDILQLPYDATDEIIELGTRESLLWLKQPVEVE